VKFLIKNEFDFLIEENSLLYQAYLGFDDTNWGDGAWFFGAIWPR